MLVFTIVMTVLSLVLWFVGGLVCGRIAEEIVKKKNPDYTAGYWFWLGLFLNFIAIILTLVVKEKKE